VFFLVGILLYISAICTHITFNYLRNKSDKNKEISTDLGSMDYKLLFGILKISSVFVVMFGLFTTAFGIGFLNATLAYHLEQVEMSEQKNVRYVDFFEYIRFDPHSQFKVTSFVTGSIFTLLSVGYALSSPVWGHLTDRLGSRKMAVMIFGAILIIIGYAFIGPLLFLPVEKA